MDEIKDKIIGSDRLVNTCKYRQGESCCKYIVWLRDNHDFFCAKNITELRIKLDATDMLAKGDNCNGL